ncbi:MAG: dihydropteroate synthase [Candidatus Altarchaeaceae archaeon]
MNIEILKIENLDTARKEIEKIGADKYGVEIMSKKALHRCIKIYNVESKIANILKQEMLSIGGDAAVARNVIDFKDKKTDVLLIGTISQYEKLISKLKIQPFKLKDLSEEIEKIIDVVKYENRKDRTKIMGILNVTPDSFYDGNRYLNPEKAVERFKEIAEYCDIVDIGGESTRPGSEYISEEEELRRVIPVFEKISEIMKTLNKKIKISIDTRKAKVAEECIKRGAEIVNDISALRDDENMVKVVKDYDTEVVLMHKKGDPKTMQINPYYENVIKEISDFFEERINFAISKGIEKEKIIIDPGIGFGKRLEDNLEILKNLYKFKIFNVPILIGVSRKSFIGMLTNNIPPEERLEGTISAVTIGVMNGADIVRVHDPKEIYKALRIVDAIKNF